MEVDVFFRRMRDSPGVKVKPSVGPMIIGNNFIKHGKETEVRNSPSVSMRSEEDLEPVRRISIFRVQNENRMKTNMLHRSSFASLYQHFPQIWKMKRNF